MAQNYSISAFAIASWSMRPCKETDGQRSKKISSAVTDSSSDMIKSSLYTCVISLINLSYLFDPVLHIGIMLATKSKNVRRIIVIEIETSSILLSA